VTGVRRRDFVAGAVGLAAVGGGAAYTLRSEADGAVSPVELETLDAPGSEAGFVDIPRRGDVTFVEFFATWCGVCQDMMDDLGEAYERVGDDVQFVSVTNEPVGHTVTREEVVEWWQEYDGAWTLGVDDGLRLTEELDASGVPTTVVVDASNNVVSTDTGRKTADEIVEEVQSAR